MPKGCGATVNPISVLDWRSQRAGGISPFWGSKSLWVFDASNGANSPVVTTYFGIPTERWKSICWSPLSGQFYPYLWTVTPIMNDVKAHKRMIQKFPHRGTVEQPKSCAKWGRASPFILKALKALGEVDKLIYSKLVVDCLTVHTCPPRSATKGRHHRPDLGFNSETATRACLQRVSLLRSNKNSWPDGWWGWGARYPSVGMELFELFHAVPIRPMGYIPPWETRARNSGGTPISRRPPRPDVTPFFSMGFLMCLLGTRTLVGHVGPLYILAGWWFGTWLLYAFMTFPSYWECHHPNWLSLHHFSEG